MGRIDEKKKFIEDRIEEGHTRPRIAEMMAEEFGITHGYAVTFVYTHFSGREYKAPAEKRKKPEYSKNREEKQQKGVLDELASKVGFK